MKSMEQLLPYAHWLERLARGAPDDRTFDGHHYVTLRALCCVAARIVMSLHCENGDACVYGRTLPREALVDEIACGMCYGKKSVVN